MIKFTSVGVVSITRFNDIKIGLQVGILNSGVMPLYCATCDYMCFESFVMTVTFNWQPEE